MADKGLPAYAVFLFLCFFGFVFCVTPWIALFLHHHQVNVQAGKAGLRAWV